MSLQKKQATDEEVRVKLIEMASQSSGDAGKSGGEDRNPASTASASSPSSPPPPPPTPPPPPRRNLFVMARGHVQRFTDLALLISNFSRLALISNRSEDYEHYQMMLIVSALILSICAQVTAGICFFAIQERDINPDEEGGGETGEGKGIHKKYALDYVAYACVALVVILNIFIATFDSAWSPAMEKKKAQTAQVMITNLTHMFQS